MISRRAPAGRRVASSRPACGRRQRHSHTLRPRGVPSASHQASHRHSGTSDSKQSASQGSTVPSGHSSGGHAHEGECWARSTGPSGRAHPLRGTGSHGARGDDPAASAPAADGAVTRSSQSPSRVMVTIRRYRIVWFPPLQAAAVIGYTSLTHMPCHISNGAPPPAMVGSRKPGAAGDSLRRGAADRGEPWGHDENL